MIDSLKDSLWNIIFISFIIIGISYGITIMEVAVWGWFIFSTIVIGIILIGIKGSREKIIEKYKKALDNGDSLNEGSIARMNVLTLYIPLTAIIFYIGAPYLGSLMTLNYLLLWNLIKKVQEMTTIAKLLP